MSSIRVAVVDDSSFIRRAIGRLLGEDQRIRVVGTAATGEELLAHLSTWRPDVITLDLAMPGMGGLATLDRIMALRPTPVIILSTHSGRGAPQTIEALHRGAVDFIDKQRYSLMDFESLRRVLLEKITEVHSSAPEARRSRRREVDEAAAGGEVEVREVTAEGDAPVRCRLLLLGASTGGPPAIQHILEALGRTVPAPVVIAQHMPEGFTRAFAERLNSHLPVPVREASHGETLLPGTVYVAPAGQHLAIRRKGEELRAAIEPGGEHLYSPSVDCLFSSACRAVGGEAFAVLLSGMGRDGARGMLELRQAGAYTVVQDEASCVVFGMPGAAVALQAAGEVLPLEAIGPRLRARLGAPDPPRP